MPSFWKVSRGWFSDEHPTEFSGDSVESLHLILLYCRGSSSGSTPSKAVLGSFPQHICSCRSPPTCRQHSWMKYQQDSTGFCDVHLTFAENLMHSFLYHIAGYEQLSHHPFSVTTTSLQFSYTLLRQV